MPSPSTRYALLVLTLLLGLAATAHALERVNLSTGFSFDCTHREPVDAAHTRLYLYTPGSADPAANFTVIASALIVSVEPLPDPPPPPTNPPLSLVPSPLSLPSPADIPTLLATAGATHNIDVDLLAAVIHTESNGRANAVSRAGARGLMQLMPATAKDQGVDDAFRPDQNIRGGTAYLDALLTRYHDNLDLALAAYNAGPAAVDRYHGIPPFHETRAYVARVEREFIRRKAALQRTNLASR